MRLVKWLGAAAACLAIATPAVSGPQMPAGAIKLIVPYPAGGNADKLARLFGQRLGETLGKTIVVENKGGAGGSIGAQYVARSSPDGATLLLAPTAIMAITPFIRPVDYDPETDFAPIAKLASSIGIVTTRKDFPARTIQDLREYGKQHPGQITYGSAGPGTLTHLQTATLMQKLGIQALHVPYKGSSEALNDLLGGRIDLIVDSVGFPQVANGMASALAITRGERSAALPDVPTLAEQGVALGIPSWFGIYAPAGTPRPIVEGLGSAAEKAMSAPDMEAQLGPMSMYPTFLGPAEFARQLKEDTASCRAVIQQVDVQL
ncbi:tripartite tricarboxylate transporter substrate binding protein [Achromobacter denitrificans]